MNTKKLTIYSIFLLLGLASTAQAQEAAEGHSVYRVTSYNFGSLGNGEETALGSSFESMPLLITGFQSDVLGDINKDNTALSPATKSSATGGFSLSAQYAPTEKIALQGSFGMTKSDWEPGSEETKSSWEANLGIIYNLFENVSYGVHFGYMDTGDVYKRRGSYSDVESVIMVSNQLTLSF